MKDTHIWFSNFSTIALSSLTKRLKSAAWTRSHTDRELDGLLGFEISKGSFGCFGLGEGTVNPKRAGGGK